MSDTPTNQVSPSSENRRKPWWKLPLRWLGRLLTLVLSLVLVLALALVILLQSSTFQTYLIKQAFQFISQKLEYRTEISSAYIDLWNSRAYFENLSIRDLQDEQMVFARNLEVDFTYQQLLQNGDIFLDEVILDHATVNLIIDQETELLNIDDFIYRIDSLTAPEVRNPDAPPTRFGIHKAEIINSYFGYNDDRQEAVYGEGIDFTHFGIDELNAELEDFSIAGDSIESQIYRLRGYEPNVNFRIDSLTTFFRMTNKGMGFEGLLCRAQNSIIRDNLFFHYTDTQDLGEFVDEVNIIAHLDSTIIDTDDLAFFAPAVGSFHDTWLISGTFRGKVSNFNVKDLDLHFGQVSQIQGEIEFSGLPDFNNTFVQLDFRPSYITAQDLRHYIPQDDIYEVFQRLGALNFQASFTGFPNDFVADGNFRTSIGNFQSDINLKLKEDRSKSYYKGTLATQGLDLGRLLNLPMLQTVDMDGEVEGNGFEPSEAQLVIDAHIQKLGFKNYNYQDIRVDGELSRLRFEGELLANDPNFNLNVNGIVDFNKDPERPDLPAGRFDLQTEIVRVSLRDLNLADDEIIIEGLLDLDTHGLTLDSLTGEAELTQASFIYKEKGLNVKSADLLSFRTQEGGRFFEFTSEFLDFRADGNFVFSRVGRDLGELVQEYIMTFQNTQSELEDYYDAKRARLKDQMLDSYQVNFFVDFKNINPVLSLFQPDEDTRELYVSKDAVLTGKFAYDKAVIFTLYSQNNIDSVFYDGQEFYDIKIDLNTTKILTKSTILAEGVVQSGRQNLQNTQFENLSLDAFWGENLINFAFKVEQAGNDNHADLLGTVQFSQDTTLVTFKPSGFQFLNENWKISEDNRIVLTKLGIAFDRLRFSSDQSPNSLISVNGYISDTIPEPLTIDIKDLEILPFASFLGRDIRGVLNSSIKLEQLYQNPLIEGNLGLENLLIDKVLIGDLDGQAQWNNETQRLNLDLSVYRRNRYILQLGGFYAPKDEKSPLNLKAEFSRTDLEIVEPFAQEIVSNLRGTLDGLLRINGTLENPIARGELELKNGQLRLNYLNTTYDIEGDISVQPSQISTTGALVFDERNNPATLNATFYHDAFSDFYLDLRSNFYDFQVLNTQLEDNSIFYGQAYATGDVMIQGFLNQLDMKVNALSKKGTKIYLPLDGYDEVSQKDYIQFLRADSLNIDSTLIGKIDLGGLKLDLNLDVTPEAEFEIIFDQKAGDIIRGSGQGNVDILIDTEGDFNIFGYYVIEKGRYNFTFANLVNKGFVIQPGGRITFNGDVYDSQMDIDAIYNRYVSLQPLVTSESESDLDNPEYRRPYPVSAVLELEGNFLAPEINLNLDLEEAKKTPNNLLRTAVFQLDNQIRTDEQERNRQVFSLLILNRLSPPNSFQGVGGAAGSSLSELLSNQFSNWISQVDENLELSFDVDANDINTFQLRVSYSLLDGRLRISRDGGFTNTQNRADFASVIGDWTVEYLLSPGGKYRIKMYNRTNQNVVNSVNLNSSTTTAGISLLHTASFNNFKEIFKTNKKKEQKEIEQIQQNQNSAEAEPNVIARSENILDSLNQNGNYEVLLPKENQIRLKHRYDELEPGAIPNTSSSNATPIAQDSLVNPNYDEEDLQRQYLEGDEDNDPIPPQYLNNTSDTQNANTPAKEAPVPNSKVSDPALMFPLPHRYDDNWQGKSQISPSTSSRSIFEREK